jgi:hypothetical protein
VNAERLHAIADALIEEIEAGSVVDLVTSLRDDLRQSVNEPGNAGPQQRISERRTQLSQVLGDAPSNGFSPAWREALAEMGIADLVGSALGNQIESIFDRNTITAAAAADELDPIVERVTQLSEALTNTRQGLSVLNIGAEELEPGEAEVGFLIPRSFVKDELESLGEEFRRLNRILGPFLELATGTREPLKVRAISSSAFATFLDSTPTVVLMVAGAVERIIAGYKSVLEIKKLRNELEKAGASDKSLKSLQADAEGSMEKTIGALVTELLKEAKKIDPDRKNELRTDLKISLEGIANRIDAGASVEVRVGELPPPSDDEEQPESATEKEHRRTVDQILEKQEQLKFTNTTGKPILQLNEPTTEGGSSASRAARTRTRKAPPNQGGGA